jgi:hypothetical protein
VHHRNGVRDDNRLENLELISAHDHASLHVRARRQFSWSRDYPACISCGTTNGRCIGAGRCSACYSRDRRKLAKNKAAPPPLQGGRHA